MKSSIYANGSKFILLLLCGCGGGGASTPMNVAPTANAGPAQNLDAGTTVTLDGTASSDANSDPISYSWVLTAKPSTSAAVLASSTTVHPTFKADVAGTYTASLTVSDGKSSSATAATVSITVAVPVAAFTQPFSLPDGCQGTHRLFVVDGHLVYGEDRSSVCPDVGYGAALYESTPGNFLCSRGNGSVICIGHEDYRAMFTSMMANSDKADLGLGTGHTVQQVYPTTK